MKTHPIRDLLINHAIFAPMGIIGGLIYGLSSGSDVLFSTALGVLAVAIVLTSMMAFNPIFHRQYKTALIWMAGAILWCAVLGFVYVATDPNTRDLVLVVLDGEVEFLPHLVNVVLKAWAVAAGVFLSFFLLILFSWGVWKLIGEPEV